jgi:hypothetical protein
VPIRGAAGELPFRRKRYSPKKEREDEPPARPPGVPAPKLGAEPTAPPKVPKKEREEPDVAEMPSLIAHLAELAGRTPPRPTAEEPESPSPGKEGEKKDESEGLDDTVRKKVPKAERDDYRDRPPSRRRAEERRRAQLMEEQRGGDPRQVKRITPRDIHTVHRVRKDDRD